MASTYTTNKGIEKPANGDYNNDWNLPVNADWDLIDTCFGGHTVLNPTGLSGTIALTSTINGSPPPLNETAPWQAPNIIVGASQTSTATLTANVNYQLPSGVGGRWTVFNNTTGAFTVTFSSAGGGDVVVVPQGVRVLIACDGTNVLADMNGSSAPQFRVNKLTLLGATSGFVSIAAPAASATQAFVLPAADGTAGQVLSTNGAGQWGWISSAGGTFSGGSTGLTPNSPTVNAVLGGTLATGYGGTGTGTTFTQGSVLFTGASGVYAQNNSDLFWDNVNFRLGIGTASPNYPLDIVTNSNSFASIGRAYNQSSGSGAGAEFVVQTGTVIAALQAGTTYAATGTSTANPFNLFTNNIPALTISTGQVISLANPLPVTSGGTGVTTSTGTGSVVLSNAPAFTGAVTMATPLGVGQGGTGNTTGAATIGVAVFQEQQTSGTAANQTTINGTTQTQRVLNTTAFNSITGASLTSNQVTLPAGSYSVEAFSTMDNFGSNGQFNIYLKDTTASSVLVVGPATLCYNTNIENNVATLSGAFTLAASHVLEIDIWTTSGGSGGRAITSGQIEVYTTVKFTKIA